MAENPALKSPNPHQGGLHGTDSQGPGSAQYATLDQKHVDGCTQKIKEGGLVKDMRSTVAGEGVLLKLEVNGCVHMPMEKKLKADNIKPFMCPIANIITDQLVKVLNYETTFLAGIDVDEKAGKCVIKCGIFADIDKIGVVSDWQKI